MASPGWREPGALMTSALARTGANVGPDGVRGPKVDPALRRVVADGAQRHPITGQLGHGVRPLREVG
jgi:hypothetical protein